MIIIIKKKMKYDELIISCITCIQEFNPNIEGPDCWAEKFLKVSRLFYKYLLLYELLY